MTKIWSDVEDNNLSTPSSTKKQTIYDYFVNMALCNTVVVNPHPHKDSMNASGFLASDGSTPSTLKNSSHASGFYHPDQNNLLLATPGILKADFNGGLLKPLEPYHTPENIFYAPPVETPNKSPVLSSKEMENEYKSHFAATRRLSVSVPVIITPDQGKTQDGIVTEPAQTHCESTPDLSEARADERSQNGDVSPTVAVSNHHNVHWFRPATLTLGRKLLELPRLAIQKLPPLGRKSPSTPSVSPGYKTPFYEAESPDELALVYASSAYGVRLVKRQANYVTIEMPSGTLEKFEILYILPFDSVRKRMSVVVRHPRTLKITLYTKGADSAVMDSLSESFRESQHGQMYIFKCQEYLNTYASYGLRTLCLAKRVSYCIFVISRLTIRGMFRYLKELPAEVYSKWAEHHVEAEMALDDREQLIYESALRIEQDLELLGITGIEDRLQDGVADCIHALRRAAICVWVLTGDKIETAVNIAYACKLFEYGMELIQLSAVTDVNYFVLKRLFCDRCSRRFFLFYGRRIRKRCWNII